MALADQIQSRRTTLGMSQAELARQANISRAYLHKLENAGDAPRPSAEVLYRIAFALGASVAELLEKELIQPGTAVADLTMVPTSLRQFATSNGLSDAEIRMLAAIEYRGKRPQTEDDWAFLYQSIQRSVGGGS